MKREQLEQYAAELELELDQLAYTMIKFGKRYETLKVLQSVCDFNLTWLYEVAPEVVLHLKSLEFLTENIAKFTRKLTQRELLRYDFLINAYEPENFDEFKLLVSGKSPKLTVSDFKPLL